MQYWDYRRSLRLGKSFGYGKKYFGLERIEMK
jgi:hypothetical protein